MPPPTVSERIVRAWRELRRGANSGPVRQYLLGAAGAQLDQAQLDALEILGGEPDGWRMSEFADALRVDPSTATRAVDRLENLGLAERSTRRGDRRIVIARATAEGRRVLQRALRARAAGVEHLLAGFDPDERAAFAAYLERFVTNLDVIVDELAHRP